MGILNGIFGSLSDKDDHKKKHSGIEITRPVARFDGPSYRSTRSGERARYCGRCGKHTSHTVESREKVGQYDTKTILRCSSCGKTTTHDTDDYS